MRDQPESASPVTAARSAVGVVAAGSAYAADAALAVLRDGGNAVDAAITGAAVQSVVEFSAGGLGGDAFFLIRQPDGQVVSLNGSGAAPQALNRADFDDGRIPRFGPLSIAVPGFVDAICRAGDRFATRSLSDLLRPAIGLADHGFALSKHLVEAVDRVIPQLHTDSALRQLLTLNGRAPGELFVQAALARTLERLASGGRDAFYSGPVAQSMTTHVKDGGGLLSEADLAEHEAEFVAPLSARYRDATVYTHSPVSLGGILLQELLMFERLGVDALDPAHPDRIDAMVRCKHAAFADAIPLMNDRPRARHDLEAVFSDSHIGARCDGLLSMPLADLARPVAVGTGSDTTCLSVTDAAGYTAIVIHSLFNEFGSRELDAQSGILLNDRLANQIAGPEPHQITGGRKPPHTLSGFVVERDDGSMIAGATPGGRGQVQTNFQFIVNAIDSGMDLRAAVDAPRWLSGAPRRPEPGEQLYLEYGMGSGTASALQDRGHEVMIMTDDDDLFGSLTIVGLDQSGSMIAAADRRREAVALAL